MRFFWPSAVGCAFALFVYSCSGPNKPRTDGDDIAAVITVDSVSCTAGQSVDVSLSLEQVEGGPRIDSIQTFIFKVAYNDSLLHCIDCRLGDADSNWDYFTWREFPSHWPYEPRAHLAIMAVRDLNSRDSSSDGELMPLGTLAILTFETASDSGAFGAVAEISFSSVGCSDNVLVDAADQDLYHMTRFNYSNDPYAFKFDTLGCVRRYKLLPDLALVSGGIEINAPPFVPPDPAITISIGNPAGLEGDTVKAQVRIEYGLVPPYVPAGFGGMLFSIVYDTTAMTPIQVVKGDQIAGWEYFDWRNRIRTGDSQLQAGISIVSILEMNNGVPATGNTRPKGDLAVVSFALRKDLPKVDACKAVSFWSFETGDNILSDLGGDTGFLPLPDQSGLIFGHDYDTSNCGGAVENCQMIVRYSKSKCTQ
jgi:hypothetical protein